MHLAERLVTPLHAHAPGGCASPLSGSESTFHAIRLARVPSPGKSKILKFEGAYHGTHDYAQLSTAPKQLVQLPDSRCRTPPASRRRCSDLMLVAPYNDLDTLGVHWWRRIATSWRR